MKGWGTQETCRKHSSTSFRASRDSDIGPSQGEKMELSFWVIQVFISKHRPLSSSTAVQNPSLRSAWDWGTYLLAIGTFWSPIGLLISNSERRRNVMGIIKDDIQETPVFHQSVMKWRVQREEWRPKVVETGRKGGFTGLSNAPVGN